MHRLFAAAFALLASGSLLAQDKITRCHKEGTELVCEEKEIRPTGYLGDKKWCKFTPNDIIVGSIALCAYEKKHLCVQHVIPADSGKCVKNPKFEDDDE